MFSDEVLLAQRAVRGAHVSSSEKRLRLMPASSVTASTIKSAWATAVARLEVHMIWSLSVEVDPRGSITPATARVRKTSLINLCARVRASSETSCSVTVQPPSANTDASPCPMRPAPTTDMFFMDIPGPDYILCSSLNDASKVAPWGMEAHACLNARYRRGAW